MFAILRWKRTSAEMGHASRSRSGAYGISAIGVGLNEPVPLLSACADRNMILLEAMHANAIRTYAGSGDVDARQRRAKAALRLKPARPNQQLRLLEYGK